jgi:hypothetical protein
LAYEWPAFPPVEALLSDEHFSVDRTLIKGWVQSVNNAAWIIAVTVGELNRWDETNAGYVGRETRL